MCVCSLTGKGQLYQCSLAAVFLHWAVASAELFDRISNCLERILHVKVNIKVMLMSMELGLEEQAFALRPPFLETGDVTVLLVNRARVKFTSNITTQQLFLYQLALFQKMESRKGSETSHPLPIGPTEAVLPR